MRRTIRKLTTLAASAVLLASAAHADIAAFNAAVTAGNYKAAAAEAATTWPTLDKSRDDIVIIAQEFGFSAFVAKDYAAARTYADFAVAAASISPEDRTVAVVLAALAAHKLKPTAETRAALATALKTRANFPDLDNITFLGADALLSYDMENADWAAVVESARLISNFTSAGGKSYLVPNTRARLYWAIADYMISEKVTAVAGLGSLQSEMVTAVNAADSDEKAKSLAALYWEIGVWEDSIGAHLHSRGVNPPVSFSKPAAADEKSESEDNIQNEKKLEWWENGLRAARLLGDPGTRGCGTKLEWTRLPVYPVSAKFGLIGSVVLQIDFDETGKAMNPEILAAIPEKYFGQAVVDFSRYMRLRPSKQWNAATCSLAQTDKRITFSFTTGR